MRWGRFDWIQLFILNFIVLVNFYHIYYISIVIESLRFWSIIQRQSQKTLFKVNHKNFVEVNIINVLHKLKIEAIEKKIIIKIVEFVTIEFHCDFAIEFHAKFDLTLELNTTIKSQSKIICQSNCT